MNEIWLCWIDTPLIKECVRSPSVFVCADLEHSEKCFTWAWGKTCSAQKTGQICVLWRTRFLKHRLHFNVHFILALHMKKNINSHTSGRYQNDIWDTGEFGWWAWQFRAQRLVELGSSLLHMSPCWLPSLFKLFVPAVLRHEPARAQA